MDVRAYSVKVADGFTCDESRERLGIYDITVVQRIEIDWGGIYACFNLRKDDNSRRERDIVRLDWFMTDRWQVIDLWLTGVIFA